jgi:hypothetical protein
LSDPWYFIFITITEAVMTLQQFFFGRGCSSLSCHMSIQWRETIMNIRSSLLFWTFIFFFLLYFRITSWRALFRCIAEQQRRNWSFAPVTGNTGRILQHLWQNALSSCLGHWKGNHMSDIFIQLTAPSSTYRISNLAHRQYPEPIQLHSHPTDYLSEIQLVLSSHLLFSSQSIHFPQHFPSKIMVTYSVLPTASVV